MTNKSSDIFLSNSSDLLIKYGEFEQVGISGYPSHSHLLCELIYLIDGDISYHIEGRSYKLKKYDLVFVRPGRSHYLTFNGSAALYKRYNILCDPTHFPRELYRSLPQDADVINFEDNETVRGIFERFEFYSNNVDEQSQKMLFCALLCELFCQFAIAAKNSKNRHSSITNATLDAALKYIDENLTLIESIESICRDLFITKSYLHHIFKNSLRISPKKYINQKRLLLARRKIRRGGSPTEVYRDCGFSDYTTFYRNYKSYFGYEPKSEGSAAPQITTPPVDF